MPNTDHEDQPYDFSNLNDPGVNRAIESGLARLEEERRLAQESSWRLVALIAGLSILAFLVTLLSPTLNRPTVPLRHFSSEGGLLCGDGKEPTFSRGRAGGTPYDQMTPDQQKEARQWCKNHPNAW